MWALNKCSFRLFAKGPWVLQFLQKFQSDIICSQVIGLVFSAQSLIHSFCFVSRFVLQPGMLAEDARLAHDLLALRQRAAALEAAGITYQAADFADVVLIVGGHTFRWRFYMPSWCNGV